ncbi:MAG: hypothetical protein LBU39_00190 [Desulfobulbaceae bacterium]|nr:hypothetical protein [Desulfobulbaceae bacterium]
MVDNILQHYSPLLADWRSARNASFSVWLLLHQLNIENGATYNIDFT